MKTESFLDTLNQIASEAKLSSTKLYALSRMDRDSLEIFNNIWPTIPVQRRRSIIQELLEITEMNFEVDFDPVFLLALGDEDANVRTSAIKSLWEYEDANLIAPLIHLLKTDEAEMVRETAASALGKFIEMRELEEIDWNEANLAEEALLEVIQHGTETINVRRRAIESISYSDNPNIPPIIESTYYHDDEKMQVSAICAMGRSADLQWLPQIMSELDNPSPEIRFEAARACGELEAKAAIEKLVILLGDESDLEIQEIIIWALGQIGGQTAREVLEELLDAETEALALAAQEALDELNIFDDDLILYDFEADDLADDESELEDLLDFDEYTHTNGHNKKEDYLA